MSESPRRHPSEEKTAERQRIESIPISALPLPVALYKKLNARGYEHLGLLFTARRASQLSLAAVDLAALDVALAPYLEMWRRSNPGIEFLRRSDPSLRAGHRSRGRHRSPPRSLDASFGRAGIALPPPARVQDVVSAEPILGHLPDQTAAQVLEATDVSELGLSVRALNVAQRLGWRTALDAALAPVELVLKLKNAGRLTLAELRSKLVEVPKSLDALPVSSEPEAIRRGVDEMLRYLGEKASFVVAERFGVWDGSSETLEDIGGVLGVTRERVRQIEVKAIRRLQNSPWRRWARRTVLLIHRDLFDPQLTTDYFGILRPEDIRSLFAGDNLSVSASEDVRVRTLALMFLGRVSDTALTDYEAGFVKDSEGRLFVSEALLQRFQAIEDALRSILLAKGRPVPIEETCLALRKYGLWIEPAELERYAELSNTIGMDWTNCLGLRRWKFFERQNVAALAQRALLELGQPSHFDQVAQVASRLSPTGRAFSGHAITATMLRYSDVFVSLGRGLYALRDWGIARPPFLKDFIAETIRTRAGRASQEEIAELGAREYGFKRSSISLTLGTNPHLFRNLGDGWFGLR